MNRMLEERFLENGFRVSGDTISLGRFVARINEVKDNYYEFVGIFSLFGKDFQESFTLFNNNENFELVAGSSNYLTYKFNPNEIDLDDFDIDLLNKIGIHPYRSSIGNGKICINCHSTNMYENKNGILKEGFNIEELKDNIEYLTNPEFKDKKYESFLKELADLVGGEIEEDTVKCPKGMYFKVEYENNVFQITGLIPRISGYLIPLSYEDYDYTIFVKDLEDFKEQIYNRMSFSLYKDYGLENDYLVSDSFKYLANKLGVKKFYADSWRRYKGSDMFDITFYKPNESGVEEFSFEELENELKKIYMKMNNINSNAKILDDIKTQNDLISLHINNSKLLDDYAYNLFENKKFTAIDGVYSDFFDKTFIDILREDPIFSKFEFLNENVRLQKPAYNNKQQNLDGSLIVVVKDEFLTENCQYPVMYSFKKSFNEDSIPSTFYAIFNKYFNFESVEETHWS